MPRYNPHSQPVGGRPGEATAAATSPKPLNPTFAQSTAEQPLFANSKAAARPGNFAGAAGGAASLHGAAVPRAHTQHSIDTANAAGGDRGDHAPENGMYHGGPPLRAGHPSEGQLVRSKGMQGAVVVQK